MTPIEIARYTGQDEFVEWLSSRTEDASEHSQEEVPSITDEEVQMMLRSLQEMLLTIRGNSEPFCLLETDTVDEKHASSSKDSSACRLEARGPSRNGAKRLASGISFLTEK